MITKRQSFAMFIYNYLNLNSSLVVTTTVTFILVIINCWQNLKLWLAQFYGSYKTIPGVRAEVFQKLSPPLFELITDSIAEFWPRSGNT